MRKLLFCFLVLNKFSFAQLLTYEGKNYFLNGANVPWHYFGTDVGTHYQWGALYDAQWFENMFADCESYGINCVRLWIHCDGRSTPEFNSSGFVTGLDANFFNDLDDIFLRAKNHNIMVMPCLWSFDMTKNTTASAGKYAGMHADLITDTLKTNSYINNALIPMVQRYANTCNLLAWEIINEPEWSMNISGGGNTTQIVSASQMQRFVGMIAKAIHHHSSKMVTVGSASLKWNSDKFSIATPCVGNFWTDQKIQNAYNHSLAYLDFYQIHYYNWMHFPFIYDPINTSYPYSYWQLDKPTIIGEIGAIDPNYSTATMLSNTFINNFCGIMFWSIGANDGHGSFNDFKTQSKNFRDNHIGIVDFTCLSTANESKQKFDKIIIYPSVTEDFIKIMNAPLKTEFIIFDSMGKKIMQKNITTENQQVDIRTINSGMYYIYLINEGIKYSQKIIKQ